LKPGEAAKYFLFQTNTMTEKSKNFIYGIRAIIEAINSGKEIDKLLLQKESGSDLFNELFSLARNSGIPIQFVPLEKLNRVTYKNHQGAVAFVSEVAFHQIEHIIPALYEEGKVPYILILDEITDVRNFGAIVRTAECAGVHAIVVPEKGSAPVNSDAMKTSAGALNSVPVCRVKSLNQTVSFLKNSGIQVFGATEKATTPYYSAHYDMPVALIMGSEDMGISPVLLKTADHLIRVPLYGTIASLNVSVAAGIVLFEISRQRTITG
jgi:23S rRNA (guanosine2251-2'-O)-methyltransferase